MSPGITRATNSRGKSANSSARAPVSRAMWLDQGGPRCRRRQAGRELGRGHELAEGGLVREAVLTGPEGVAAGYVRRGRSCLTTSDGGRPVGS